MGRLVAPLIAAHNHIQEQMHGTAFVIAPELALTAKHVVVDYLDRIQEEGVETMLANGKSHHGKMTFFMFMLVPHKNGRRIPLRVVKAYFSGTGDIAILRLNKPPEVDWEDIAPFPVLRLLPPPEGTEISALGYPDSSAVRRNDGVVELHTWPRISLGQIQEIHYQRRDSVLLNFPCFQINARLDGGMSGGPVLDENGRICGVISRSFELSDEGEPIGYAASIWTTAVTSLSDLPKLANDSRRFYDLLREGKVQAIDLNDIQGGLDAAGKFFIHVPSSVGTGRHS